MKEEFDNNLLSKQVLIQPSVAVPVGYKTTTLKELFAQQIKNGTIIEDKDGLIWIKQKSNFISLKAADVIQFQAISGTAKLTNKTGQTLFPNDSNTVVMLKDTFYVTLDYSQGKNGEVLDSIRLNNMLMQFNITTSQHLDGNSSVLFPEMKYNSLQYKNQLIVNSSNQFNDFMGYTVQLQTKGTNNNQLKFIIDASIRLNGDTILPDAEIFNINYNFSQIDWAAIFGYLGKIDIKANSKSFPLDFANPKLSGYFNFSHPQMSFLTANSIGAPIGFSLNNFLVKHQKVATSQVIGIDSLKSQAPAVIGYPSFFQIGQTVRDSASTGTSPIRIYSGEYKTSLNGDISGQINPNGKLQNFVLKESQLDVDVELTIPFWGYTDNLIMMDTLNYVLKDFYKKDYIQITRLLFILNYTNRLPVSATPQIYFLDGAKKVLDSLFTTSATINGPTVANAQGRIEPLVNDPIKSALDKDRVLKIENTQYLVIRAKLKTINFERTPPDSWKFFTDYYLYTHIGIAADMTISP
jgi:hypothetical protein